MKEIDSQASEFMKKIVNGKENVTEDEKKTKMKMIQELFNKAKEFGDDKVRIPMTFCELLSNW
jgi:hypothetical protein